MTYIRAWVSSKSGLIRPGTTELAALEHQKKLMLPLFLGCYLSDRFKFVGIQDIY